MFSNIYLSLKNVPDIPMLKDNNDKSYGYKGLLSSVFHEGRKHFILYSLLLYTCWEFQRIAYAFYFKKPQNVKIIGASTLFRNILTSFESLFNTGDLIDKGYARSNGKPYAVPQLDKYLLLVSSPDQIHELVAEATRKNSKISSQVLGVDLFEPEYTLSAYKGESETHIASNHLKHKMMWALPDLFSDFQHTVKDAFDLEMKGEKMADGWEKVTAYWQTESRAEIKAARKLEFRDLHSGMPYLDSFLREVGRLNPLTHVALPRKVLSDFTFLDGTYVPKNNWICVPHDALMTLPEVYPKPKDFDGFRFVKQNRSQAESKERFWDMSRTFPFWGNPKTGCPARYYVSLNMKLMAIHFIENYEFKAIRESQKVTMSYHVLKMPHPKLKFMVRRCSFTTVDTA